MPTKPKPKWQLLQKLRPDEVAAHLANIRKMLETGQQEGKPPTALDLRPHLEPLLKHYHLSHTVPSLTAEINAQTGLTFVYNSYAKAAADWGIPPANKAGRGLGKPGGAKSKFNKGRF